MFYPQILCVFMTVAAFSICPDRPLTGLSFPRGFQTLKSMLWTGVSGFPPGGGSFARSLPAGFPSLSGSFLEITRLVHEAGGLCYYDGANLNAVMGVVRPGDMGFDCVHLNLHKTFATPHGGGGPGAGAVGCKAFLAPFLPHSALMEEPGHIQVRGFRGNFLVVVRALAYLLTLGREGVPEAAQNAVLNANYLMQRIKGTFTPAFDRICMHEFVLDLSEFKKATGVSALDVAKSLIDYGMHPPTMYFPLIVHEALMLEPTETESKETLDWAAEVFRALYELGYKDPAFMHAAPHNAQIGRPDEVKAARNPIVRYTKA